VAFCPILPGFQTHIYPLALAILAFLAIQEPRQNAVKGADFFLNAP
jgi:hypothetical protein